MFTTRREKDEITAMPEKVKRNNAINNVALKKHDTYKLDTYRQVNIHSISENFLFGKLSITR